MPDNIIQWLLEESDPSVRFYTLTTLLGKSGNDPEVRAARRSVMENGPVPQILELQNDDGSWDIPEKFYNAKYTGTSWVLLLLAELQADPEDARIRKGCEFIFEHSHDHDTGGFSYTYSARKKTALANGVIPCLTGNMASTLIRLGCIDDSRLQKSIEWITKYQRADDGADWQPEGDTYTRFEVCWGRHSCHMGVAKALKALAAIPPDKRNQEINAKINELTEYFLKHHLYKKSHDLSQISKPGWLKLGFPLMYQTDILELLEIFASLSIKDPRLTEAIEIIRNKQLPDGTWQMENSYNGKMPVRIEKKGRSSKWITCKALNVLQFYEGVS